MIRRCNWRWPIRSIRPWWMSWATSSARRSCRWWRTRGRSNGPSATTTGIPNPAWRRCSRNWARTTKSRAKRPKRRPAARRTTLRTLANETPIIRFVNLVLFQAVQDRASDIHFEPFEDEFKIRYRVDGALYEMSPPPKHLALPVISRLKVMSSLDISERRLPQDGRISMQMAGRQHRLARLHPADAIWRIGRVARAGPGGRQPGHQDPGFSQGGALDYVTQAIQQPNGIIVVTGPTGCGKTTTLYSCLRSSQQHRIQTADRRGPGGIRHRRHHAGGGQRSRWHDLRQGACAPFCGRTRTSSCWGKCAIWRPRRLPFRPR